MKISFKNTLQQQIKIPAKSIGETKPSENKEVKHKLPQHAYIYPAALLGVGVGAYFIGRKMSPKAIVKNTESIKNIVEEKIVFISEKSKELCESILKGYSSHYAKDSYKSSIQKLKNLSAEEKKYFIKLYEEKTGFPNTEKVSETIKEHAINVMEKAAKESGSRVVFSAYDKNCSIGRKLAIPGTDIDEWGIVIDGNQDALNKFKEVLYGSYDQNIMNIISDHPKVFSLEQVKSYLAKIDNITAEKEFQEKSQIFLKNMNEYTGQKDKTEYISNSTFNIMLADKLPYQEKIDVALDLSATIETLRDGNVLINNLDKTEQTLVENSSLYKYGNFLQQRWRNSLKSKHASRIDFDNKYKEFDDDKKIRLFESFIEASFENKPQKNAEFGEFFNNTEPTDNGIRDAVDRILGKNI